jgi:uncharacterized protein (TIGR00369 family)
VFTLTLEELNERHRADHAASGVTTGRRGAQLSIDRYESDLIVASTDISDADARKGGTLAGSAIFTFFDSIGYVTTLAQSPKGTEAFTTDVSIHFLRPAPMGRIVVEARPLRFGRRSSVVAVTVSSPNVPEGPIASGHITFAPVFPDI